MTTSPLHQAVKDDGSVYRTRRQFLRSIGGAALGVLASGDRALAQLDSAHSTATIENEVLRVTLSFQDAVITVLDKRIGFVWRQDMRWSGFEAEEKTLNMEGTGLGIGISDGKDTYGLSLNFVPGRPHALRLRLDVKGRQYTVHRKYKFAFEVPGTGPGTGWYYVQNTTGEGMLMRLDQPETGSINKAFRWSGGQPWWGITDLDRAMSARLDSFRRPDVRPEREDQTVYASPLVVEYAFFTEGGYVSLAKDFRDWFLGTHPEMLPLAARVAERPAVGHLKDSVYLYFWGDSPAEDLRVATEMKEAGIDRGIAVFYGRHEIDRTLCDGIKRLGWTVGRYQMPTGNLFQVSPNRGWPDALLTGGTTPEKLLAISKLDAWDRVCGKAVLDTWPEKAAESIREYGVELFYFDTLAVQLTPCIHPDHPSTIEENLEARKKIMSATRALGMVVGTGEGICPTWALPEVDFFEGQMSLRTYTDPDIKIPSGGYADDLGDAYQEQAAYTLDETRRIPLYQLGFHDYVVGTWVWRDTSFQSTPYAWKKHLLNILYGTMPIWHVTPALWEKHRDAMLSDYKDTVSVRGRIGFAQMLRHGWLTEDRSVQYTDWDTGDRVIVNFGERVFERSELDPIFGRSFATERLGG